MTPDNGATGLEIAVIGMAGRFPKAGSVDELWDRVKAGDECISFFSDEELLASGVDPAALLDPSYVRAAGVVDDVDRFDAGFFGYSPREAALIDPQQRLFLEIAWTALEHAGYAAGTFDAPVGVYGGVGLSDYFLKHVQASRASSRDEMAQVANDKDFLTTRISYKLNLSGPSLVVQTACSTSLVAIHLACQALIAGECDMALAGGVTVRLPQQSGYPFQEGGIGSPDGHCRAFSAGAQGCVPGNGGAIVVLKRLSDALADGDFIHAVVKGSAINNDGARKIGYTAPSVEGQARVIRAALGVAGASADTIGFLEAHGTGTSLGDPIEIQAATDAYRQDTARAGYCSIGSIKTNIGHLDAGAGVAGLIKAVLAVEHGILPPTLHYDAPNPQIDFERSPFYVNSRLREWPRDAGVRRAGVSSFGIGGTNAHVVLEEPPLASRSSRASAAHELLILSAKTGAALERSASQLAGFLRAHGDVNLADVAFTLRAGRASLPHRRAIVCGGVDEAIARLSERSGASASSMPNPAARVVFMFPGQGAQYPGMARELYETHAVFRRHVDRSCEITAPLVGVDLREIIAGERTPDAEARLRDTRLAQPAIFTVSYALAQLLIDWGVQPVAMIGHSIGEYVAACLSGVIAFEDALTLVCARGTLMASVAPGSMLAVPLGAGELETLLPRGLALAAINAPRLSVVSGGVDEVEALASELQRRGIEARPLHTSHAFHSPMMDPVLDAFVDRVRQVRLSAPRIPYVSNLTGTWMTRDNATDPAYWARHLRHVVRFSEGLQTILEMPGSTLVEVGPGRTLTTLAKRHTQEGRPAPVAIATTPRAEDRGPADRALLEAMASLWTAGVDVDWPRVRLTANPRRLPLPTYPFQRERFWLEPITAAPATTTGKRPDPADWFSVPTWERCLGTRSPQSSQRSSGVDSLRAPRALRSSGDSDQLWVVLADVHGLGEDIVRRLRAAGRDVVMVSAGGDFTRLGPGVLRVRPGAADDYRRLSTELAALKHSALHVVHCWTVDPDEAVRRGLSSVGYYQERGFYSLLFLAQALAAHPWLASCRVSVVTSNVHEVVGTETICPEKATIVGPCRVIPLEDESFDCGLIDVVLPQAGSADRASLVEQLLDVLDQPAVDVVAVRGTYQWRPALVPARLARPDAVPLLKKGGVYLITGGLGGLGLAVARRLWETTQARLVLVGRTALPPRSEWDRSSLDAGAAVAHVRAVAPDVAKRVSLAPMSEEDGLERTLDRLSAAYVADFLAASGIDAAEARVVDRAELRKQCRVQPRFRRLFDRMLQMLEPGTQSTQSQAISAGSASSAFDVPSSAFHVRREAVARYPHMTPVFELLDNCARHYPAALAGEMPAIELLFGEGHNEVFARAVDCVRDRSYVPLCQELVRELLSNITAQANTQPLRILEVGGGEGVLTKSLLPLLEGRPVEYHFTDIGRSFVVNAERYAAERGLGFMRFGTLDISRDPTAQGFPRERFDLVVAFNVVHATKRVAESLAHARQLLAPGGVLVLLESVRPVRWVDLVWGLTDGWWAFEDEPLRTTSPLLDVDAWKTVLRDAGFDLVTALPDPPAAGAVVDTSVIVGRKPAVAVESVTALEASGAEVEVVAADVADRASLQAAVDRAVARFGRIDGVVHAALVLDDGPLQEKTRASVERVFAPKVNGTLVLEEVCKDLDLDFFVIFSSLVSLLGGRGQVDYCGASAFQDAFAHATQGKLARSVIAIDWGAWREIGKAFRVAVERGAAPADALPEGMSPEEGLDALMRVLASPFTQVVASAQDPLALRVNRERRVVPTPPSSDAHVRTAAEAPSPVEAERSTEIAPRTETERVIAHIWQEVLGVPRVGVSDNFFDLGGDSVISLQFIAKAKKAGLRFTKGQVFEHQTVAELAAAVTAVADVSRAHVDDH